MMQLVSYPQRSEWPVLAQRPAGSFDDILPQVAAIVSEIRRDGDAALLRLARRLDGARLPTLAVSPAELAAAAIEPELLRAIRIAADNIRRYHQAQLGRQELSVETMPGIRCTRRAVPIERVGLYIPGGSAPLFSTLLMLAIPAQLAGCTEIVVCTPPQPDGSINPAILGVSRELGITQVYKLGGAGAVAAMALGTATVPKVDKIFGPGNRYVTAAKLLLASQGIAIDMPAGPSELAVVAGRGCVPEFVAADLLSQAEHGADSQVLLLSDDPITVDKVREAVQAQLASLPRRAVAEKALENSRAILFDDLPAALGFSNYYAPEHLIIAGDDAAALAGRVRAAGSVFLGNYSPESAGDYASGTNHALPTGGAARAWSGIGVSDFQKTISFQELSREGLAAIAETIERMALAEGLQGHASAVTIRKEVNNHV